MYDTRSISHVPVVQRVNLIFTKYCKQRSPRNPQSNVTHTMWFITTKVVLPSVGDMLTNLTVV